MRTHPVKLLIVAALIPLIAACGRRVAVESEPGPAYVLEVINPMPHPMIVSYDDGTGTHLLGTVSANDQGRFVITRPARQQITVIATDEQRTQTVTRPVTLTLGTPAEVTLVR